MLAKYQNQTVIVWGQRGTGKTTWIYKHLNEFEPFIIVDPVFDPKFNKIDCIRIKSVDEAVKMFKYRNPRRVYISPNLVTFDFFCMVVLARGNMNIIIDECDHYATSWVISPNFKKLVNIGRHRNIGLVCISRRPKNMSPVIRNQASRYIVFQLTPADAKDTDLGTSIIEQIPQLKSDQYKSEYIDYDFKTKTYITCSIDLMQTAEIKPVEEDDNIVDIEESL